MKIFRGTTACMCTYPLRRVTRSSFSCLTILSSHPLSSKHRIPIYPGVCTTNDLCSTTHSRLQPSSVQFHVTCCVNRLLQPFLPLTLVTHTNATCTCHPLASFSSNNRSLLALHSSTRSISRFLVSHCRSGVTFPSTISLQHPFFSLFFSFLLASSLSI